MGSKLHQYTLEGADALRRFVYSGEFSGAPNKEQVVVEPVTIVADEQPEENSSTNVIETPKYDENSNDNGGEVPEEEEVVVEPKRKRFKKEKPAEVAPVENEEENGYTGRKTRSSSRWSSKR